MPEHHSPIAQPVGLGAVMPTLSVVFDVPVPSFEECCGEALLHEARRWYREQANALVSELESHCPGGFMDALLGSLLARKASIFVVPDVIGGGIARGDHT